MAIFDSSKCCRSQSHGLTLLAPITFNLHWICNLLLFFGSIKLLLAVPQRNLNYCRSFVELDLVLRVANILRMVINKVIQTDFFLLLGICILKDRHWHLFYLSWKTINWTLSHFSVSGLYEDGCMNAENWSLGTQIQSLDFLMLQNHQLRVYS
jgi:hypothetical protein